MDEKVEGFMVDEPITMAVCLPLEFVWVWTGPVLLDAATVVEVLMEDVIVEPESLVVVTGMTVATLVED